MLLVLLQLLLLLLQLLLLLPLLVLPLLLVLTCCVSRSAGCTASIGDGKTSKDHQACQSSACHKTTSRASVCATCPANRYT